METKGVPGSGETSFCKGRLGSGGQKLQALISHQLPTVTNEELLHLVLDEALARREKKQGDIAGGCLRSDS